MCETEVQTPIDAYAVALDETTNYEIDETDRPYIECIVGVYLFDRNQRTRCCELTPSYWLIHLYDQVRLTPAGQALDEYQLDEIYQKYEYCGGEDIYVHCHSVERIIAKANENPFTVYHYGDPEVDEDDVDYDDQMEGVREYLCGNCPF
jgi:hypothetical protein